MIIPPRCFTCGNPIADKWIPFIETVKQRKDEDTNIFNKNELNIKYIDTSNKKQEYSIEGKVLNEMGLHKYCCRVPFIANVHLITSI
jgi:DNA-directed RNA polymerase subunit N (RpoN/RPB10)